MDIDIPEQQWQEIDAMLFAGRRISALRAIHVLTEPRVTLIAARDLMYDRYDKLRREQPERFACDDKTYWADWIEG